MIAAIPNIDFKKILSSKGGKIATGVIGLLLLVWLVSWLIDKAKEKAGDIKDKLELDKYLLAQVKSCPDGIVPTNAQISQFLDDAAVIADMQEQALGDGTEWSTEEISLVDQLKELDGWELVLVAYKFGVREYNEYTGDEALNIFGWYDEELSSFWSWSDHLSYEGVEGCESWTDMCSEREVMRTIWKKSGIPN